MAVTSHLLSAARKFLGCPERINGDEMNNRRLSNEEEKVPFAHTHARTGGRWKRAGDAFLA